MTDIDFDELDRAVNSLMQPKQPSTDNSKAPVTSSTNADSATTPEAEQHQEPIETSETPVSQPDPIDEPTELGAVNYSSDATPADNVDASTDNASASEAESTIPPRIATKKRGQFMDVMHSSSNMKQSDPAPKLAPRKVSLTLQPTAPETPSPTAFVSEPVKAGGSTENPESAASEKWSDPIDMMNQQEEKMTSPTAEPSVDEQAFESQLDAAVVETEPLSSPFLADAKVEKRPLGGIQPESILQSEPVPDPELTESSSDDVQENTETVVLPEELQQDVLAIESDMTNQVSETAVLKETETSQPTVERPTDSKPVVKPAPIQGAAMSGSLPQSLPVHPDEDEDGSHPDNSIFDTDQYQAPIKHPVKKKSGWPVIIAILGLILLGTGGGVAFFLLSNGY